MKRKPHTCTVTITVRTSVNGGPWTSPCTATVHNGDELKVYQPVVAEFAADGAPWAKAKRPGAMV